MVVARLQSQGAEVVVKLRIAQQAGQAVEQCGAAAGKYAIGPWRRTWNAAPSCRAIS